MYGNRFLKERLEESLSRNLIWDQTPEGYEYWVDLVRKVPYVKVDSYEGLCPGKRVAFERSTHFVLVGIRDTIRRKRITSSADKTDPTVGATPSFAPALTAHLLASSFDWAKTEEGFEYWATAHKNLLEFTNSLIAKHTRITNATPRGKRSPVLHGLLGI